MVKESWKTGLRQTEIKHLASSRQLGRQRLLKTTPEQDSQSGLVQGCWYVKSKTYYFYYFIQQTRQGTYSKWAECGFCIDEAPGVRAALQVELGLAWDRGLGEIS